jgi:hypothetical protein
MGTLDDAFNMKNELRRRFNLPPIAENPSVVLSKMPPATPPPNPIDLANEIQFSSASSYKRKKVTVFISPTLHSGFRFYPVRCLLL